MYKLERGKHEVVSKTTVLKELFPETIGSTKYFVISLAGLGCCFGIMNMDKSLIKEATPWLPLFIGSSAFYAKKVYENYKKERARMSELANQIDAERKAKRMLKEHDFNQFEQDFEEQGYGKRKALNNGIFTPNSQY